MNKIEKIPDEVGFSLVDINSASLVLGLMSHGGLCWLNNYEGAKSAPHSKSLRKVALSHGGTRDGQRPLLGGVETDLTENLIRRTNCG